MYKYSMLEQELFLTFLSSAFDQDISISQFSNHLTHLLLQFQFCRHTAPPLKTMAEFAELLGEGFEGTEIVGESGEVLKPSKRQSTTQPRSMLYSTTFSPIWTVSATQKKQRWIPKRKKRKWKPLPKMRAKRSKSSRNSM